MKKRKGIILAVCILSILLGCITMHYPNTKENSTNFSYTRAKEDLKVITKEPHSTVHHQEALKDVRQYIVKELEELNMNPEIFSYKDVENDKGEVADLNNIYGKIDGKNGEDGSYILLVAHYDSAGTNPQNDEGYSYGASDDGYGVVTILETLRNIRDSGKTLENGIKVLITDGEEMHLIGSREEFNNNFSLYKNVSYVINLEARGTSGSVIMFQTSEKNDRVLNLYKNANYPVTSSLITDLYKESGRSDFLNIKNRGLAGINFTTLDNVEYYHTPEDSYKNISDKSLKHYGDQVLPIVEEFIYSDKYNDLDYFKQGNDSIFFMILPNVILDYSVTLGRILAIIIIIAVIVTMIHNRDKIKGILKSIGKNLIHIIGTLILGLIISLGLATVSGVNFTLNHMGNVPGDDILVIVLPIVLLVFMFKIEMKKKENINENFFAGVLIQTILLSVSMIFLPGASYLTMIPLMLTLISLAIIRLTNKEVAKYTLLLTIVAMIILYIPLINIFRMAFSIGSLPFIFAILMIMKSLIVPTINKIIN
ncbi:M20/M25/M40 family metallo-hydrolase [Clostridium uliginosum]|uniref:Vacuolar membrane protease n=1 Tax=Clostridium uliginosum TaxID=119641 RepID=A0A1I1RPQ4_9CLOT|nr:M20/M25/M40 family metallo-hydrolase [Clostridium uliginosum]SFD36304.1 Peptidase family M28 [Clostridium uliginosum]